MKNRQQLCSLSGFVPSLVVEPSRLKDVLGGGTQNHHSSQAGGSR